MKKVYLVMAVFFIVYLLKIYFDYHTEKNLQTGSNQYTVVSEIEFNADIDDKNYIFDNKAWNVKSQKKIKTTVDENKTNEKTVPIKIDKNKSPITICDKDECYEFIGLNDKVMVFFGKKKSGALGFINALAGDSLNERISILSRSNKSIELFDTDLNQTLMIDLFDINVSMYKPKEEMETKNEK